MTVCPKCGNTALFEDPYEYGKDIYCPLCSWRTDASGYVAPLHKDPDYDYTHESTFRKAREEVAKLEKRHGNGRG